MKNNRHGLQDTRIVRGPAAEYATGTWPLTGFDLANFRYIIRGTWVFGKELDTERLRSSLERLLAYYPHIAGRISAMREIDMNNEGVPFTLGTEPVLSICDLVKNRDLADGFSTPLDKPSMKKGTGALMSVKYTVLKDGSVLGVRCSHLAADGASFYSMMYNWGKLCRGEKIDTPVLDQTLFPAPGVSSREESLRKATALGWKKFTVKSLIKLIAFGKPGKRIKRTRPFYFSANGLRLLKTQISAHTGSDFSTHVALSAFLTWFCIRLNGHDDNRSYTEAAVVDLRRRMRNIPESFAGNAAFVVMPARIPANAGLGEIAQSLHKGLAPYTAMPSPELEEEVRLGVDLMHHRVFMFPYDITLMFGNKPTLLYINNFSKFPIYCTDFGAGNPVYVIPHDLPDPILIWPDPGLLGGVEVYFTNSLACAVEKLQAGDPLLAEIDKYSIK